jgi:hypothetical protein
VRAAAAQGVFHGIVPAETSEAGSLDLFAAKKRMRATLTAIRGKLYQRRHEPVPIVGKWLQRVLNGYFAVTQFLRTCCD